MTIQFQFFWCQKTGSYLLTRHVQKSKLYTLIKPLFSYLPRGKQRGFIGEWGLVATFWGLNNTGIDMFLCSFIVLNGPTATRFCPSLNLLRFNFNIFLQFYWLPLWWHFCPLYHQYLEPEIFNMPLFIEIYLWWWNLKSCIMFYLFITKENILSEILGTRLN